MGVEGIIHVKQTSYSRDGRKGIHLFSGVHQDLLGARRLSSIDKLNARKNELRDMQSIWSLPFSHSIERNQEEANVEKGKEFKHFIRNKLQDGYQGYTKTLGQGRKRGETCI